MSSPVELSRHQTSSLQQKKATEGMSGHDHIDIDLTFAPVSLPGPPVSSVPNNGRLNLPVIGVGGRGARAPV